jgi:hypothetical protein
MKTRRIETAIFTKDCVVALKRLINKSSNPVDCAAAGRAFFGVSGDKFTSNPRFKTDLSRISKSQKNKMSSILGAAELEFIQMLKEEENTELLEEVEEFPVPLETLYNNPRITQGQLGKGVKITLEFENNKVRRNIDLSKEVTLEEEEEDGGEYYKKLHEQLKEVEMKYKRTAEEIADIFVKVSGDLHSLKRYFEGDSVILWTYLEDLALTKPEDSMEYKCLLEAKGKEEIEKRKMFLLRSEEQQDASY